MHIIKDFGLRLLAFLLGAFAVACFSGLVIIAGAQALNHMQNTDKVGLTPVAARIGQNWTDPVIKAVHVRLPVALQKRNAAPLMIALVLVGLCILGDNLMGRARIYRLALVERRKAEERATAAGLVPMSDTDPANRDKVLELYAKTKKILDGQRKEVAFLSVDVVNSTGMKEGEDAVLMERDFRQYRKLVEKVIARHGALKSAWTPDGVMICFPSLRASVDAGQELLRGLNHFNKEVKSVKSDFKVRCGINAGAVMIDEQVKMEEMADAAIDLAGHMQKYAAPNTIFLAARVVEGLPDKLGFKPAEQKVDGLPVCEWRCDLAPAEGSAAQG